MDTTLFAKVKNEGDMDRCRDVFLEAHDDNSIFVYGVHKRPTLPHEREDTGHRWILTNKGDNLSEEIFKMIFPDGSDYHEDSGLWFD